MTSSNCSCSKEIIVVWLDDTKKDPEKIFSTQNKNATVPYIKSTRSFSHSEDCIEYIQKMNNVLIFFIVSDSFAENILPLLHDLPQLKFVYISSVNNIQNETWRKQFRKIKDVFTDDTTLLRALKIDICSLEEAIFPIGLFHTDQQSLQDLNMEQASFMWFHLLTEVIRRLPQTQNAKDDLVDECRANYANNPRQLDEIAKFEKTYQSNQAISWYTKGSFLFQLFNITFRMQDFETIFKYRFFLVDLFNQLTLLHKQQIQKKQCIRTVYRGQLMFEDELRKLQQNIGHLVSINTFFSTSITSSVASTFSGNGDRESLGLVSVIFQIDIDLTLGCRPFANIKEHSYMKDEDEILFCIGTIFCVESVELETDTIWQVNLTMISDIKEKMETAKDLMGLIDFYTENCIGENPSVLLFGAFLSKMGRPSEAMHFYRRLVKVLPRDHPEMGLLYNNLGEVLRQLNYINLAKCQFDRALQCFADAIPFFHPYWVILYSNMALLNITDECPEQALKYYRSALFLITKLGVMNDGRNRFEQEILATLYHGMGTAYYMLRQYQQAFQFYQKALDMELLILPADHPSLIDSYEKLGMTHIQFKRYAKALENFQESLRIAEQRLHGNGWRLVFIYITTARLVYWVCKDQSKALLYCSSAERLLEQSSLPKNNAYRVVVYRMLISFYSQLGLGPIMYRKCMQLREAVKDLQIESSEITDVSQMAIDLNVYCSQRGDFDIGSRCLVFDIHKLVPISNLTQTDAILQCNLADHWRAIGRIDLAIYYYQILLQSLPTSNNTHFLILHKSRLYNNLAASYQDKDDNENALHHYLLALETISNEADRSPMQVAITHYNIALIYKDLNQLDKARMHLEKSLIYYLNSSDKDESILQVKIYTSFAKTYEQCNDWEMARDYYQRALDICIKDKAPKSVIEKYSKWLQHATEKIHQST